MLCTIDYASMLDSWHGVDVELVHDDDSVSIATADPMYWELEDFKCFLASDRKEASLGSMMKTNSRSEQSTLKVCFNG